MLDQPLVSVILTSYNRPRFLPEAIECVLEQDYENLELLVMDDNSSIELVHQIIAHYAALDRRVRPQRSTATELDRTRTARYATLINQAAGLAGGKYLTYLPDDDIYFQGRLRRMVGLLETGVDVVYGSQLCVNIHGVPDPEPRFAGVVLDDAYDLVDHASVMHSARSFHRVGGWDDRANLWGGADAHFWRRLTNAGYLFHPLDPSPTDAHRYHEKSVQWEISNGIFPFRK